MKLKNALQLFGTAVVAVALLHQYTDVKLMPVATAPTLNARSTASRRTRAGY